MADPMTQMDKDYPMAEREEGLGESMVCDSSSRLIPCGFSRSNCKDEIVMFVNAGGEALKEADSSLRFVADAYYRGGDMLRTDEYVSDGGDYPSLYQSARMGNFSYQLENISPGDYYVDLHFAEIINTNGPKGLRLFNVFIQDEKVLSDFDIFAVVGANKPLQLIDTRVSINEDERISILFEGVLGSPVVSGICIRRAPKLPDSELMHDYIRCHNCAAEVVIPVAQEKSMRSKSTAKYEKKVEELKIQCQQKTNECYQAWMSLNAANKQLEKVRMELDNCSLKAFTLDRKLETQAEELKSSSNRYEHDKKAWMAAIVDLDERVKRMKQEHSHLSRAAHKCADSIPELNKMLFAVQSIVRECKDLREKYVEEQTQRKKLYNQIQEAKGNIRVFCRCRPPNKQEQSAGCATIVDFDGAKDGEIGIATGGSNKKTFKFDRVYTLKDDQEDVFADASSMVVSVLDGYNVCIFAYGQTGTGKTFTMEGTPQNRGVNYRTLEQLFEISKERSDTFKYDITVSVLEVYNEQIRDLLATSSAPKKLEIKQAPEGSHHVPGIVEAKVKSIKEVWEVLQAGSNARAVGSNNVNEHSSRSHCMLCIMVTSENLMNGECTKSKLCLVDLAGSERLAKTEVEGERLKEAKNINKSLAALGDVISALANKSSHIPYRNSKLTHLLQDSLGGDSKTLMFVQISPSELDLSETLSSLNFASRVRGVEFGPARRQIDTSELQKTKMQLDKIKQESKSKDEIIRKLEENLLNMENKARSKDQTQKSQQERIRELEDLQSQSEKQISLLHERMRAKDEACINLSDKAKELERKVRERENADSTAAQQFRDLEKKLRDQVSEHELQSVSLQRKIQELEDKLRKHPQQHVAAPALPTGCHQVLGASPTAVKSGSRNEVMDEVDLNILRSSNSSNRVTFHGHLPVKGNETSHENRRKREYRYSDAENNTPISGSLQQDKKIRKSDPPKPIPSRTTAKPTKSVSVAQRPLNHGKMSRDLSQGSKDRDAKRRVWC